MSALAVLAGMVVNLLTALLPTLGATSTIVDQVIVTLIQILPIVVNEATALIAPIQNIIAALKSSTEVTPAQMTQLEALEAQTFAAFDATAAAAGDPDPDAAPSATSTPAATS